MADFVFHLKPLEFVEVSSRLTYIRQTFLHMLENMKKNQDVALYQMAKIFFGLQPLAIYAKITSFHGSCLHWFIKILREMTQGNFPKIFNLEPTFPKKN